MMIFLQMTLIFTIFFLCISVKSVRTSNNEEADRGCFRRH